MHALASFALSEGPRVQGEEPRTRWLTAGVGAGVFGVWPALALAASAELELGYRRIDVDFNGQNASDQELPLRVRALISVPAEGPLAATGGVVLRLPPQSSARSSGPLLASAPVSFELLAGIEVRL
jgi:hypothetical protein